VAARRRPSYGFDLAGTAFGVKPEVGVSRGMLSQLFPEIGIKTTATDTEPEEVDKPEESSTGARPTTSVGVGADEDTLPGSTLEKISLKGSFSLPIGFNFGASFAGPSGPQGRGGSRLGYSGSVLEGKSIEPSNIRTQDASYQPVEEQTKADRLLSSFIGEMGTSGVVGATALGGAFEYGYTPEQVLNKAKQENLTFGEQAAKTLGLSELTQYQGPLAQGKTIGLEALDKARSSGMSDTLIKQLAKQQGVGFGLTASSQLGVAKVTDLGQYIGGVGSNQGTLGLEAVKRARQAGLSDSQIRDLASQQGLSFGSGAATQLGVQSAGQKASAQRSSTSGGSSSKDRSSTNLSKFIGGAGSNQGTLGLEAVKRARQSGLSDSQIRQMASQQGLGFGSAARSALGV